METVLRGQALVLGDNIDTDQIYPGRYLELVDPFQVGNHCLAGIDEQIAPNFKAGDMIVAGSNFGCGSSREHAVISLMSMGVSVLLADSFARIFYRNALNLGLPLIVCKGISKKAEQGSRLTVDIATATIRSEDTGEAWKGEMIGDYAMALLEAGGIKPLFRSEHRKGEGEHVEI